MIYWEEFTDKYGFCDGEEIPAGVEVYRAAYCLVLNEFLKKNQSKVRVLPMNVGTIHNGCRIVIVPLPFYEKTLATANIFKQDKYGSYPDLGFPASFQEAKKDDAFAASFEAANELHIDDFINTEISLGKEFDTVLNSINNGTYQSEETKTPAKTKEFGSVFWSVEDIKKRRPNWSTEHCESFLECLEEDIREKMCEAGWSVIEEELNDDTTADDWNEDNTEGE